MSNKKHTCKLCGFTSDGVGFHGKLCPECRKTQRNNYFKENKDRLNITQKEYYQDNREKKNYYKDNKIVILSNHREYERKRMKEDLVFKIRKQISSSIRASLKKRGSIKFGESLMKYLSYSILELKRHLENHFEYWMTWDNQGKYDIEIWNDNDASTWTWQLDHIIPQADLPYTSMTDDNFRKCWALNNLRPLSAKQNLLDGALRTRHNK